MDNIVLEYIQLGAVAALFVFFIFKFFDYLKAKKNGNGNGNSNQALLDELQKTNTNHLDHIRQCMEDGNCRLIDVIHSDNTKVIEILSRIDGKLDR